MKMFCMFYSLIVFTGCTDSVKMQQQIDDLTVQQTKTYKPGFGEFMSTIQVHHAKLWFAGKNSNWRLAEFELNEIGESVEAIQKYLQERKETQALPIILPVLDSVKIAVQQQDQKLFVQQFTTLTKTCNACHQSVQFEFNVVKIPDAPPFSNQDFTMSRQ